MDNLEAEWFQGKWGPSESLQEEPLQEEKDAPP